MKNSVVLVVFANVFMQTAIYCASKRSNPFYLPHEVTSSAVQAAIALNALIVVEGRNAALLSNGDHSKVVYSGENIWGHYVAQVHKDHVVLVKGTEKIVLRM